MCPGGVDKVLELVGTTTLKDSLRSERIRRSTGYLEAAAVSVFSQFNRDAALVDRSSEQNHRLLKK